MGNLCGSTVNRPAHEEATTCGSQPDIIDLESIVEILSKHDFEHLRMIGVAVHFLKLSPDEFRDELCIAWGIHENRDLVLWQILYHNLRYSTEKRKRFYDLTLRHYFQLADMTSANLACLVSKLLRELEQTDVNDMRLKEILTTHEITGSSFPVSQDFVHVLRKSMRNDNVLLVSAYLRLYNNENDPILPIDLQDVIAMYTAVAEETWHEVYQELISWRLHRSADQQCIDWERIGQIMLDHRFLPDQRQINLALDHLETFCTDEDLSVDALRDELCRAYTMQDDRGTILSQVLCCDLKYSANERKYFCDLILHEYFELRDMNTANMVLLIIKSLRDSVQHLPNTHILSAKQILIEHNVNGSSIGHSYQSADDFADLFWTVHGIEHETWRQVYNELSSWRPSTRIIQPRIDLDMNDMELLWPLTSVSSADHDIVGPGRHSADSLSCECT